jgi:hypothetical protein
MYEEKNDSTTTTTNQHSTTNDRSQTGPNNCQSAVTVLTDLTDRGVDRRQAL